MAAAINTKQMKYCVKSNICKMFSVY